MTNYNTSRDGGPTERALYNAYLAGMRQGVVRGALMMMLPVDKNAFRQAEIARIRAEYETNATALRASYKYARFWPQVMPGGWPLPPPVPSDDESTWWPEVDGWPCPPPTLRGQA